MKLPVGEAQRDEVALVVDVEKVLARRLVRLAAQVVKLVVAVEVDLVAVSVELRARFQAVGDVLHTHQGREGHEPVIVGEDPVQDRARGEELRVADEARHAERALPVGVLLAAEGGGAGVGPGVGVRAFVGEVLDELRGSFLWRGGGGEDKV